MHELRDLEVTATTDEQSGPASPQVNSCDVPPAYTTRKIALEGTSSSTGAPLPVAGTAPIPPRVWVSFASFGLAALLVVVVLALAAAR